MLRIQSLALMFVIAVTHGDLVAQEKHNMTKADVERQIEELSNWGRWGKDDQLGALNILEYTSFSAVPIGTVARKHVESP